VFGVQPTAISSAASRNIALLIVVVGVTTLIGSAANGHSETVHLHILVPDGAYTFEHDKPHFHRALAPSPTELCQLLDTLIARITRTLVRGGEEPEHPYLDLELNSPLEQLSAAAVRYPFAVGPRVGRKTMTLRNPGARLHGCRR
jgi:hypothetical protein